MFLSSSFPVSFSSSSMFTFSGTATDLSLDPFNQPPPWPVLPVFFSLLYLTDLFPFALFHHTAGPSQPRRRRHHHRHPPAGRTTPFTRPPAVPSLPHLPFITCHCLVPSAPRILPPIAASTISFPSCYCHSSLPFSIQSTVGSRSVFFFSLSLSSTGNLYHLRPDWLTCPLSP